MAGKLVNNNIAHKAGCALGHRRVLHGPTRREKLDLPMSQHFSSVVCAFTYTRAAQPATCRQAA